MPVKYSLYLSGFGCLLAKIMVDISSSVFFVCVLSCEKNIQCLYLWGALNCVHNISKHNFMSQSFLLVIVTVSILLPPQSWMVWWQVVQWLLNYVIQTREQLSKYLTLLKVYLNPHKSKEFDRTVATLTSSRRAVTQKVGFAHKVKGHVANFFYEIEGLEDPRKNLSGAECDPEIGWTDGKESTKGWNDTKIGQWSVNWT